MRSAIINADDFGLSPGVNKGILDGFRQGVLSSTTMLANLPSFDDAAAIAADNPDLPVGVHLSLLWGPPVSEPDRVPTLLDGDGVFFRSAVQLVRRSWLGGVREEQIALEFRNQVRKVVDAGLRPTHFDTHKHIHALPIVRRALISVAGEFGVERVRCPCERCPGLRGGPHRHRRKAIAKRALIRWLSRHAAEDFRASGLRTSDHFTGIAHSARLDGDALLFILRNLEDGVTEIMCHPGYIDDEMKRYSAIPPFREVELDALRDERVREYVDSGAVRLTHYGELV